MRHLFFYAQSILPALTFPYLNTSRFFKMRLVITLVKDNWYSCRIYSSAVGAENPPPIVSQKEHKPSQAKGLGLQ